MIDDLVPELLAELGRQREAVLVVEGVVVFAEQHGPLGPTLTHNPPHVHAFGSPICAVYGPFPVTTAAPARAASSSASASESPRASAKQSAAAKESPAP